MTDTKKSLLEIYNECVAPEVKQSMDWDWRLRISGTAFSFGRANGTFSDVLSILKGQKLEECGMDSLMWGYGMLLHDNRSPIEAITPFVVPMGEAFLDMLDKVPLKQQTSLLGFERHYRESLASGRFKNEETAMIEKVCSKMINNWLIKEGFDPAEKKQEETSVEKMLKKKENDRRMRKQRP